MQQVTLLMLALALMSNAESAALKYRPQMTGEQLVRDLLAAPDGGLNSIRREHARGYIGGVMDAAAGTRWCPAGHAVPHELDYVVVEEMQSLSSARLKGGAAALLLAALAKHYPCGARR